ncbi:hypothetical protein P7C73_g4628, partial [Tremellales sp. Uapishka_1]
MLPILRRGRWPVRTSLLAFRFGPHTVPPSSGWLFVPRGELRHYHLGGYEPHLGAALDGQRSTDGPRFGKVLIANRTVAIFSEADRSSLHVLMADEAYCVGPAPSSQSYAIHPGYGFLSESSTFASAVEASGLTFIGPPSEAIRSMGSKRESKEIMTSERLDEEDADVAEDAGVPCVPGYHGVLQDLGTLSRAAIDVGFPLLIKPTHGGGGKGMRICRSMTTFEDDVLSAKREAIKSFGNDELLLERYLEHPRHIEVQVFADKHGNCQYHHDLFSLQRTPDEVLAQAALYLTCTASSGSPWSTLLHRRFGPSSSKTYRFRSDTVVVSSYTDGFNIAINGQPSTRAVSRLISETEIVTRYAESALQSTVISLGDKIHVFDKGTQYILEHRIDEANDLVETRETADRLQSPMPATVIEVRVRPGEQVKEGQVCCVLESMKMEINVRAGRDGKIEGVNVEKGQVVEEGAVLVTME